MSEQQPPPKKRPSPLTRPLGTGQLGQDSQTGELQGIGPAVVDAFLSAGPRARANRDEPEEGRGLFTAPVSDGDEHLFTLPRNPPNLGEFQLSADSSEVKARFKKVQALAQAARLALEAAPPETPHDQAPPAGSGVLDPILQQHLAKRSKPLAPKSRPTTGNLPVGDSKLQHLAKRAKAKGESKNLTKLEKTVEAALGEKGALKLRQSLKVLEDKALPGRLGALAVSVNRMLPEGSDRYAALGLEVGKQVVQNNVNPLLAISMAVHELSERAEQIEKWGSLSNKDRIANLAMITSNLSEILGAVTPPPVSYGIQVLGAGMLLVGLATEHSETVEDLAKVTVGDKASKSFSTGMNDATNGLASKVKGAWDDLSDRLAAKKGKPRLPGQVQTLIDSPLWKSAKQHPTSKKLAEGAENVMYNLAKRYEAFTANYDHRIEGMRKAKRKRKPKGDNQPS